MTKSGKTFAILSILWKVFLVVIIMHLICIAIQFCIAGAVSKKNPLTLIKNQIPGYTTALGTQSSAATIPVNLQCAETDGVCEQIRNFVVPLCANIHMAGSMITITACATAVCLMNQLPISLSTVIPFIMTLGIAMVASPAAPGGSIMTALPFLYMIFGAEAGDPDGAICAIMVALYITQDSFGTVPFSAVPGPPGREAPAAFVPTISCCLLLSMDYLRVPASIGNQGLIFRRKNKGELCL